MHIHTVYFWLKSEVSAEQRAEFSQAVAALGSIASVRECYAGQPIASERAVVDDSFDVSLHLKFDTTVGHDAYQVDPKHDEFVDRYKDLWAKVTVYDTQSE